MAYAITPEDASVEDALHRIVREEAQHALGQVHGGGELAARVHEMRKVVKKLRGLVRLVRPVFPEAQAENAILRDAGRSLSGLRDADVQLATAEKLSGGMPEERRTALLAPFREAAEHHVSRAAEEMLPPFSATMEALIQRSESWTLDYAWL
jgi:CHAD domain-containing protein